MNKRLAQDLKELRFCRQNDCTSDYALKRTIDAIQADVQPCGHHNNFVVIGDDGAYCALCDWISFATKKPPPGPGGGTG